MRNMIERYVYAVMKRLPNENKEEIERELYANIDDMLGDDHSEVHIESVLLALGEPRKLALQYKTKNRYLISPLYFDDYVRVLKLVMIIFLVVSLVFNAIDLAINYEVSSFTGLFTQVFTTIFDGIFTAALQAFAWVTVVFFIIERAEEKSIRKAWKPSNLPEIPKNNDIEIKRSNAVAGLVVETIFSVIFIILLISYLDKIGIYENFVMVAPLFDNDIVRAFTPILIASIIGSLVVSIFKVFYAKWNLQMKIIYTLGKIFSVVVFIVFINYPNLFNILMFEKIAAYLNMSTSAVINHFNTGIHGFSVFLAIVVGIDLIVTWLKNVKIKESLKRVK